MALEQISSASLLCSWWLRWGFCLRGLECECRLPLSCADLLRTVSPICSVCLLLRMIEIARAMRLKISKRSVSLAAGRDEDHKLGTLSIPLPPAQNSDRQSKRRRIT